MQNMQNTIACKLRNENVCVSAFVKHNNFSGPIINNKHNSFRITSKNVIVSCTFFVF